MVNAKVKGALMLITVLIVGFILGSFMGPLFFASGHQPIIDQLKVEEPSYSGKFLTVKCVATDNVEYGKGLMYSFTQGKTYPHSTWIFTREGDVELVVSIWGPGDDGVTFNIEVARLTCLEVDVYFKGSPLTSFNSITNPTKGQGYVGYVIVSVTL